MKLFILITWLFHNELISYCMLITREIGRCGGLRVSVPESSLSPSQDDVL